MSYMDLLKKVIDEAKKEMFTPEAQSGISDDEVLGNLVSKFTKWDLVRIVDISKFAAEDSNFTPENLVQELENEEIS